MKAPNFWIITSGLILVFSLSLAFSTGHAQDTTPEGPIYIVSEGDSLWSIALRFRVSVDDLVSANDITNANQLTVGTRLVIPGLEGIQGVLTTQNLTYGENLLSLSRRFQLSEDTLVQLNHLTSPAELYTGSTLVIPVQEESEASSRRVLVSPGQSLLELAILQGSNPWEYTLLNNLPGTWGSIPGDVLHITSTTTDTNVTIGPGALPESIHEANINPSPLIQGKTALVRITGVEGLKLTGQLNSHPLNFFEDDKGNYVSLQGIHAMAEPGLYPLTITGEFQQGSSSSEVAFSFTQTVLVSSGDYFFDPVLTVPPETIDPSVTKPEDEIWAALSSPVTAEKSWQGEFQSPAPEPFSECWPSLFGNRRSYNGSPYEYFHTGLDFCGGVGTEIFAPARGVVVFAGPLTVRGNATVIDHGWGVYSGYLHQSEILVSEGDMVEPGQVIGLVGGSGRVTGPHLHWEIWVGGVQVDPMEWLENVFPGE